jgi:anti-anti-sigma regulatory factor
VDLSGAEFIDYCGLRVLVRVLEDLGKGRDHGPCRPRLRVRGVFEITGLIGAFSVYPSMEQAVAGARLARSLSAAVS